MFFDVEHGLNDHGISNGMNDDGFKSRLNLWFEEKNVNFADILFGQKNFFFNKILFY